MKTYQEYYNEWQISTESRDLAFDEWLMLQLERQKQQIINKACEWILRNWWNYGNRHQFVQDFRKAMEE